jgi:hypothetical protein
MKSEDTLMTIGVSELKGVTAEIASALYALGIYDTAQLLAATGQPIARAKLAEALGIDANAVLELAKHADLTRIHGLTVADIDLLALAAVDSVMELSRRIPENLYAKLMTVAAQQHLPHLPRLDEVQRWVREAKQLERAIFF